MAMRRVIGVLSHRLLCGSSSHLLSRPPGFLVPQRLVSVAGIRRFSSTTRDDSSRSEGNEGPRATASPFEFGEEEEQKTTQTRRKGKKEFDPATQIRRGWGDRARVARLPGHQKNSVIHTVYHIRISHRKLNRMCVLLRRKSLEQAEAQLAVSPLKAAKIIRQVFFAALHQVDEKGWDRRRLFVAELLVGRGVRVKQIRPWHGRGRFGIGTRYRAHLTVVFKQLPQHVYDQWFYGVGRGAKYVRYMEKKKAEQVAEKKRKVRRHLPRIKAILPPPEFTPKTWLIRSQMDINAVG